MAERAELWAAFDRNLQALRVEFDGLQHDLAFQEAEVARLEAQLKERTDAERRVFSFVAAGGYDEELAERVLTDPIDHAFGYVADWQYQRAEQMEAAMDNLARKLSLAEGALADLLRTVREGGCRDCDDLAKERDTIEHKVRTDIYLRIMSGEVILDTLDAWFAEHGLTSPREYE